VVLVGLAVGFDTTDELKPVDGDQEYVYPGEPLLGVAVSVVELPLHIAGLVALAEAVNWSTVTATFAVTVQLLASVTVKA